MAYISHPKFLVTDQAMFAYNPCYVIASSLPANVPIEIEVTIGTQTIKSIVIGDRIAHRGRIDITGLLQSLWAGTNWNDLENVDTIKYPTFIIKGNGDTLDYSGKIPVIYGSMNVNEGFMGWGNTFKAQNYTHEGLGFTKPIKSYRRVAKWYSNLPCELPFLWVVNHSVYDESNQSRISGSLDLGDLEVPEGGIEIPDGGIDRPELDENVVAGQAKVTVTQKNRNGEIKEWEQLKSPYKYSRVYKITKDMQTMSEGGLIRITSTLFDIQYNWRSFNAVYEYYEDTAIDGYYLRWIDNFGLVNYYLFDKGKVMTKTKSIDTIDKEINEGGIDYPTATIDTSRTLETTLKCSATCLDEELYQTVKTVIRANHVQLYLGKQLNDDNTTYRDVWMPVRLTASQETEDEAPKRKSLEVNIILPLYHSQSI